MSQNEENNNKDKQDNPFSLPEGYFGSFGKKMMHKIELAEELKEFPVLSSIDKKLPFVVPGNYFLQSEVRTELSVYPKLASVDPVSGFTVPELYFETSAKAIKTGIEEAVELKPYPVLYSIDKVNAFAVPQNYFEDAAYSVREKLNSQSEGTGTARILHLVFSKKTAYAIAALLVISLGLYFYNSGEDEVSRDCNGLACMDKNEILKSTQINTLDEQSLMEIVDPEQLSKNLNAAEETKDKQEKQEYIIDNVDANDIIDEI